jgi:hypothetical protein
MTDSQPSHPAPAGAGAADANGFAGDALTRAEADELLARWLVPDPDDPSPAAYRVTEQGPEVWALAGYLAEANTASPERRAAVLQLAASDFRLPPAALWAALVFYRRHPHAIEARAETNRPWPEPAPVR